MKNKFAIKILALLLCCASLALSALSVTAVISNGHTASAAYDGAAKNQTKITMKVCTAVLSIYGNPELSGPAVATRSKGDRLTVSTEDGVVYKVHTSSGVLGYCHAGGLIYTDTKTYAALPYLWEYVEELVAPPESTLPEEGEENNGTDAPENGETTVNEDSEETEGSEGEGTQPAEPTNPSDPAEPSLPTEPTEPETVTVLKYSDLVDVNFFAYDTGSVLGTNSDTVMLQRDYLKKLEALKGELSQMGLTVFVKTGYSLSLPEGTDSVLCPASSKSGALATLIFKDTTGAEYALTQELTSLLENAGILRVGDSSLFYLENHSTYLCPTFTSADLIYMIYG